MFMGQNGISQRKVWNRMTNVTSTIDFEVSEWFDVDGTLMIDVYTKGADEPIFTHEVNLHRVVSDFIDMNSVNGVIQDGADEDTAYDMIDEFQTCIDNLNDALEDYDAEV